MFCPSCGSECKDDWKFCVKCSSPITNETDIIAQPILVKPQRTPSKAGTIVKLLSTLAFICIVLFTTGIGDAIFSKPKITMEKYSRIQTGMSYNQVCQIIGEPGEELATTHVPGIPGVMGSITDKMYGWTNKDGSNFNAMFENDKLINKAQLGLK